MAGRELALLLAASTLAVACGASPSSPPTLTAPTPASPSAITTSSTPTPTVTRHPTAATTTPAPTRTRTAAPRTTTATAKPPVTSHPTVRPTPTPTPKPTPRQASPSSTHAGVSISRGSDPETGRRGIDIVYRWDPRFGRGYDARVRLYENGTLVGQIRFLKGWDEAPAFFRTAATGTAHSLWAVGDLLDRSNHVVAGSSARSVTVRWNVTVQPGQVVP